MAKDRNVPLGIGLLGGNAKVYNTIAEMQKDSKLKTGKVVEVLGYYQAGDGAGHKRVIADSDDGSGVLLDNGLYANIVHNGEVNVSWFGAKGDGVTDDTEVIKKVINYGGVVKFDFKTYACGNFSTFTLTKNLSLIGNNTTFKYIGSYIREFILIVISSNIDKLFIKGFNFNGENKVANFIRVNNDSQVKEINICNNYIQNLNNLQDSASVSGIRILSKDCLNTFVENNYVKSSKATTTNPSVIGASGITVVNIKNKVVIKNNYIEDVSTPLEDSDGIVCFREEVTNKLEVYIDSNTVVNPKGRFVKLQCDNVKVFNNKFVLDTYEIIQNFRGVDSQSGGVEIYNNVFDFKDYTGGESASFIIVGLSNNTKRKSNYIVNNFFKTNIRFPYGVLIYPRDISGGEVYINNNISSTEQEIANFIDCSLIENIESLKIVANNNSINIGQSKFFTFDDNGFNILCDDTKGQAIYERIYLEFKNNTNLKPGTNSDLIYLESVNGKYPFLQYVSINSNTGFTDYRGEYLTCRGMDIKKLPNGSKFGYKTDGSTGGLINAPSPYHRYVMVESTLDGKVEITNSTGGKKIIIDKNNLTYYEYVGQTQVESLNTPYHIGLMEQEGGTTKQDFYTYLGEKFAYDKQLEAEHQVKYEAYELLLQDNPNLTWEDFEQQYGNTSVMNLNLVERLEEPTIPESVVKFMEKYLGTTPTQKNTKEKSFGTW